ncbi:hypothetical protein MTO96_017765 [Rhipicephalus appendiculatus]
MKANSRYVEDELSSCVLKPAIVHVPTPARLSLFGASASRGALAASVLRVDKTMSFIARWRRWALIAVCYGYPLRWAGWVCDCGKAVGTLILGVDQLPILVRVLNQTGFRATQQQRRYGAMGMPITAGEAAALADSDVREKMATDDMVESAGTIRRVRQAELARRKIVPSHCSNLLTQHPLRAYSRVTMCAANLTVDEGRYQLLEREVFNAKVKVAHTHSGTAQ